MKHFEGVYFAINMHRNEGREGECKDQTRRKNKMAQKERGLRPSSTEKSFRDEVVIQKIKKMTGRIYKDWLS